MLHYNVPSLETMHYRKTNPSAPDGRRSLPIALILSAMALLGLGARAAEASPRVVVTVQPLHSIVAGIMGDAGTPALLIRGGGSPHSFALKPSQAELLQRADAVFWVGPELERFLVKPLRALASGASVVALAQAVPLLPYRSDGVWGGAGHDEHADRHEHKDHHGHEDHKHGTRDPHFWLDALRVKTIVPTIAKTLSAVDPANAERYRANAQAVRARLDGLHRQIETKLAPVGRVPYLVFHDAYQYFERRYGLHAVGTVTLDPEYRPGARHLDTLRRKVAEGRVRCIFREPQFAPAALAALTERSNVRVSVLDPLGASLRPGPDAYFLLLETMADSLRGCLGDGTG